MAPLRGLRQGHRVVSIGEGTLQLAHPGVVQTLECRLGGVESLAGAQLTNGFKVRFVVGLIDREQTDCAAILAVPAPYGNGQQVLQAFLLDLSKDGSAMVSGSIDSTVVCMSASQVFPVRSQSRQTGLTGHHRIAQSR